MIRLALATALSITACAPVYAAEPMTNREVSRVLEDGLRNSLRPLTQGLSQDSAEFMCMIQVMVAEAAQQAVDRVGMLRVMTLAQTAENEYNKAVMEHVAMMNFRSVEEAGSNVMTICMESAR